MRIRRGKAEGFKRAGRLFVYPNEQPNAALRETVRTDEQTGPERRQASQPGPRPGPSRQPFRDRGESARAAEQDPDAGPGGAPEQALPVIVEFQKIELTRLLRDNTRLNQRLDQLMDEVHHLIEMQQREQVLRQQDQALRQQTQGMIERLTGRLSPPATPLAASPAMPPGPPSGASPGTPRVAGQGAVSPAASAIDAGGDAGGDAASYGEPEPLPAADQIARSTPAGPQDPGPQDPGQQDPGQQDPAYAYGANEAPGAEFDLEPGLKPGPELGASPEDPLGAAAELAEILREVGESLRDLDAVPARAPGMPGPLSPEAPPEASVKASAEPAETRSPGTAEAGTEIGPGRQSGAAGARIPADLAEPPGDEEGRLLEILGRMGPSAEDRRTAARIMKRLLRSRGVSRPREPDS